MCLRRFIQILKISDGLISTGVNPLLKHLRVDKRRNQSTKFEFGVDDCVLYYCVVFIVDRIEAREVWVVPTLLPGYKNVVDTLGEFFKSVPGTENSLAS